MDTDPVCLEKRVWLVGLVTNACVNPELIVPDGLRRHSGMKPLGVSVRSHLGTQPLHRSSLGNTVTVTLTGKVCLL